MSIWDEESPKAKCKYWFTQPRCFPGVDEHLGRTGTHVGTFTFIFTEASEWPNNAQKMLDLNSQTLIFS